MPGASHITDMPDPYVDSDDDIHDPDALAQMRGFIAEAKRDAPAPEPVEVETLPASPGPSLADLARLVATADVVEKAIKDRVVGARSEVLAGMLALRSSTSVKSIDVLLDQADPKSKVATISLTENNDKPVLLDEDAYTSWVEKHYPTEVEYRIVVRESFKDAHLKGLVLDPNTGTCTDLGAQKIDETSGELADDGIVAGVRAIRGGEPTSFRLSFTRENPKKNEPGGRARVMAHLDSSTAAALMGSTAPVVDGEVVA